MYQMSAEAAAPKPRIVVFGASGVIGTAVCAMLEARSGEAAVEVVRASKSKSEHKVDVDDEASLRAFFEGLGGKVDHIVFCAGTGAVADLAEMSTAQLMAALTGKFVSQAVTTLVGQHYLNRGGSITLTSGILEREPCAGFAAMSAANAAITGWVKGAALDMRDDKRINVVSPGLLAESAPLFGSLFPGFKEVSSEEVARAYIRCIFAGITGRRLEVVAERWYDRS